MEKYKDWFCLVDVKDNSTYYYCDIFGGYVEMSTATGKYIAKRLNENWKIGLKLVDMIQEIREEKVRIRKMKESIKRKFINEVYGGNYKEYLRQRKADYCKVQLEWSYFIDALCKDGEITQKQYDSAVF